MLTIGLDIISLAVVVKQGDLKSLALVLSELGLSYEEAIDALSGVVKDVRYVRRIWRREDEISLIKLGLALIAFPEPWVSDILGAIVLSIGIVHAKMRKSPLHIEDVYNTFQDVMRELETIKQGLSLVNVIGYDH